MSKRFDFGSLLLRNFFNIILLTWFDDSIIVFIIINQSSKQDLITLIWTVYTLRAVWRSNWMSALIGPVKLPYNLSPDTPTLSVGSVWWRALGWLFTRYVSCRAGTVTSVPSLQFLELSVTAVMVGFWRKRSLLWLVPNSTLVYEIQHTVKRRILPRIIFLNQRYKYFAF